MDNILEVKNLKVSFRTQAGTLKAVRDITLDLKRGKTLAIVGESGSGKSVTAKAILGILAGNTIIEGGEILYDGKDLLKISEEDFHNIRGDKISMIFQDPLSSLDPIVKIGRQITEAMLLKSSTNRRVAKVEYNKLLGALKKNMYAAAGSGHKDEIDSLMKTFERFCLESNHLENAYNISHSNALDLLALVENFLFLAEKNQHIDVKKNLADFRKRLKTIKDRFLVREYKARMEAASDDLGRAASGYRKKDNNIEESVAEVKKLEGLLKEITEQTRPDFFSIGYYKLYDPSANLDQPVETLNAKAEAFINEHFLPQFTKYEEDGVKYSFERALVEKKDVLEKLKDAREFFSKDFTKPEAKKVSKAICEEIDESIDELEYIKDSRAYTFRSALNNAIDRYFFCLKRNPKEEARFARQTARRARLIARGKTVTWKVIPKAVYSKEELSGNILLIIDRMSEHYEGIVKQADQVDFTKRTNDLTDHLKKTASQIVYRVTKSMAKEKAIKLMDEVGIHEPRLRYNQYPFEFSGGMRQRIVIAIALAANPDILICDEPTTALDVTIQSQILELINKLKAERGLSIIFITHDLGVVANMADDIAVMYAGKIVEYGSADEIFYDPRHPYTWALLSSMPDLDTKEKLDAIPGTPPNMIYPPAGDAFAARNKYAMQIDYEEHPPFFRVTDTHYAATWLLHPDAPKVEVPKAITDRIRRMTERLEGGAEQ
ncbi:MAG: ABC transporter ATP-binding protein [Clostridia bacterium]|nr:ABC transporter ATP-binding protein [Clostridia bacterium]